VLNDPDRIEIDFIESRVQDHSGVEALRNIANKYKGAGKSIKLTHLSPECQQLLIRRNPEFESIIEKSIEDPRYHIATDLLDAEV
jgi:SulP family sulfate permease